MRDDKYIKIKHLGFPRKTAFETEDEYKNHIQNMINAGAIPLNKLEINKKYKGICRNADEAIWNGENFVYIRTKFNMKFEEKINHFEVEEYFDAFIPYEKLD